MSVALPAGVFVSVLHHLHTSDLWDLRYGMLAVTLTYVIAYIIAFIMMKALKVPRGRRGIFINMVVNDNCLFIGLPVQIALFGQDALPYFLLYYIGNTISVSGLKSMSLNKDSIGGIIGRFVISPIIMFCVIMGLQYGAGIVLEPIAIITFVVQSAGPVIAVLPIVANESKSDLPFATGLVMISTILFVVAIPIIMEILTMIGITA